MLPSQLETWNFRPSSRREVICSRGILSSVAPFTFKVMLYCIPSIENIIKKCIAVFYYLLSLSKYGSKS